MFYGLLLGILALTIYTTIKVRKKINFIFVDQSINLNSSRARQNRRCFVGIFGPLLGINQEPFDHKALEFQALELTFLRFRVAQLCSWGLGSHLVRPREKQQRCDKACEQNRMASSAIKIPFLIQ